LLSSVPTGDLQQLKHVTRADRKQIVVDSITSRYWPDIRSALQAPGAEYVKFMGKDVALGEVAQPQVQMTNEAASYYERFGRGRMVEGGRYGGGGYYGGGGGGYYGGGGGYGGGASMQEEGGFESDMVPGQEKTTGTALRGYLVTIRGTTPNKGKSNFVDAAFVQKLLENTAEQQLKLNKSWYIARAEIVQVGPRNVKNQPQYDEGGEENAELTGEAVQLDKNGKPIFDPKRDRLFPDELITNDVEFVVLAVICIDPAKAPPDPNKKPAATPQ